MVAGEWRARGVTALISDPSHKGIAGSTTCPIGIYQIHSGSIIVPYACVPSGIRTPLFIFTIVQQLLNTSWCNFKDDFILFCLYFPLFLACLIANLFHACSQCIFYFLFFPFILQNPRIKFLTNGLFTPTNPAPQFATSVARFFMDFKTKGANARVTLIFRSRLSCMIEK